MIHFENVTKEFDLKPVVDCVDLHVEAGERVTIIGPSGCGKSTSLRLISGLIPVTSGRVIVDGVDITTLGSRELARMRMKFGMVFQSSALFDSLTVAENVGFALSQHTDYSEKRIRGIVTEKLEMVGLKGVEDVMPSQLSGGMQKRVAFARAIVADPKIVLYDEPTTGLDPITSSVVENLINKLNAELNITSVIVTHQISTIFNTSDRIIMMHEGKFIPAGAPAEAKVSKNPIVYRFLNGIVPS